MENDWKIIGPIMAALVGIYGWFLVHIGKSKKHPCKDDIVYKDVCKAQHDCVETELKGMKELMELRFDNLEELVKKK